MDYGSGIQIFRAVRRIFATMSTCLLSQKALKPTFTRILPFVSTKKALPLPRKILLIHQYPPFVGEKETVLYV